MDGISIKNVKYCKENWLYPGSRHQQLLGVDRQISQNFVK